jgi:uncharacterized protein (DUF2126 family)
MRALSFSTCASDWMCPRNHALPGYEDTWYYMWKERRLPVNVDPFENKLENTEDRARLARVFERGLDHVVGYALPLKREYFTDGTSDWVSGAWFFRPERMYLIPGDSPMGFRLPLDSIPWVHPSEVDRIVEQDPMAVRGPLPERAALAGRQRYEEEVPGNTSPPRGWSKPWNGAGARASAPAYAGA